MPTYGYECLACANQFETTQSIKDAPLTTCDLCGGSLRKRIYPVGIAFKGSGFYVNDYAPKAADAAPAAKSDTAAAAAPDTAAKPAETKADAPKTEAAPAAAPKADTAKTDTAKTPASA